MSVCQWLENGALHLNNYRVIPRLLLLTYWELVWKVCNWYMAVHDPSGAQTTFVSIIVGAMSVVVGLYLKTGNWQRADDPQEESGVDNGKSV